MFKILRKIKIPNKFLTFQKFLGVFCIMLFAILFVISKDQKSVKGIAEKSSVKICTLHVPIGQTNSTPPKYLYPTLSPGGKYCDYPQENKETDESVSNAIIYSTPTPMHTQTSAPTQSPIVNQSHSQQTTTTVITQTNTNPTPTQTVETKIVTESTPAPTPTIQACVECAAPPAGCNYQGLSCNSCGTIVCTHSPIPD